MPQFVEVRFKGNRRDFYEWHDSEPLREREAVLVETDRGVDLGHVGAIGQVAHTKCERCGSCGLAETARGGAPAGHEEPGEPGEVGDGVAASDEGDGALAPAPERAGGVRRVVRRASAADVRVADELRGAEEDVRRRIRERAVSHKLVMKVSDAEWQWDRKKLTVYFTAEKRVDFRNLVRDLASQFRTRIELRQIGVRDEAVRLDGIGRCGRRLCSASFLTEIRPIGLQIAKDQHLSLNPAQISGPCGRLLCCLRFEHEFYVQARKRFPKEGKIVQTSKGAEKVLSIDIFRELVALRGEDGTTRSVPLAELRDEVDHAAPAASPPAPPASAPPPREAPAARTAPATPAAGTPTGQGAQGTASPPRRRRRRGRRRPPPSP